MIREAMVIIIFWYVLKTTHMPQLLIIINESQIGNACEAYVLFHLLTISLLVYFRESKNIFQDFFEASLLLSRRKGRKCRPSPVTRNLKRQPPTFERFNPMTFSVYNRRARLEWAAISRVSMFINRRDNLFQTFAGTLLISTVYTPDARSSFCVYISICCHFPFSSS